MSYNKTQVIDAGPTGDTIKESVLKNDQNMDVAFVALNDLLAKHNSQESDISALQSFVNASEIYTSAEKSKLSNIQDGADVNVQSDWDATGGDAFINNKPAKYPDAAKLNGAVEDENYSGSTIVKRDANGDIRARIFRQYFTDEDPSFNFVMTQTDQTGGVIRPASLATAKTRLGIHKHTVSTAAPSGGDDGDIWLKV